jgi:hypothetical protein
VSVNGHVRTPRKAAGGLAQFVLSIASGVVLLGVVAVGAFVLGAVWAFVVQGFQITCDWLGCR